MIGRGRDRGRSTREPSSRLASLALITVTCLLTAAGCGGGDNATSPASLKSRLLPASAVPGTPARAAPVVARAPQGVRLPPPPPASGGRFKVERYFAWKNPIDVVGQGFFLPEATQPSQGVDVVKKAGFDAGAGELLTTKGLGPQLHVDALKFKSASGAGDVRDWLHQQDLMQPCYQSCSENVSNLRLNGIPGAKATRQVPLRRPPPDAPPPFDRYAVEYTIGPYLYVGSINGGPGEIPQKLFEKGAKAFYGYVKSK